jgi:hypothetical protein
VFAVLSEISFDVAERGEWSARCDAELATLAAHRLARPQIERAIEELASLGEDRERLWSTVTLAEARRYAASGVTRAQYQVLHPEATRAQLVAFEEVAAAVDQRGEVPLDVLMIVEALARAQHATTAEPAGEQVDRDAPAPGTEAAALVIQAALDAEALRADEVLAAAGALARGQTPLVPPPCTMARRSAELDVLAARLADACLRTARAVGCELAYVKGDELEIPALIAEEGRGEDGDDTQGLMLLAGDRVLLVLLFRGDVPRWTSDVAGTEAAPPGVRLPEGMMTLVPRQAQAKDARYEPRAVAGLRAYVVRLIEEHLAAHPGDADLFPVLDDDVLERMFG